MPNKYKKLPGTCTLHLMPIVFGAPQPQVSLSISKPVKPTAPHLQLPPPLQGASCRWYGSVAPF